MKMKWLVWFKYLFRNKRIDELVRKVENLEFEVSLLKKMQDPILRCFFEAKYAKPKYQKTYKELQKELKEES